MTFESRVGCRPNEWPGVCIKSVPNLLAFSLLTGSALVPGRSIVNWKMLTACGLGLAYRVRKIATPSFRKELRDTNRILARQALAVVPPRLPVLCLLAGLSYGFGWAVPRLVVILGLIHGAESNLLDPPLLLWLSNDRDEEENFRRNLPGDRGKFFDTLSHAEKREFRGKGPEERMEFEREKERAREASFRAALHLDERQFYDTLSAQDKKDYRKMASWDRRRFRSDREELEEGIAEMNFRWSLPADQRQLYDGMHPWEKQAFRQKTPEQRRAYTEERERRSARPNRTEPTLEELLRRLREQERRRGESRTHSSPHFSFPTNAFNFGASFSSANDFHRSPFGSAQGRPRNGPSHFASEAAFEQFFNSSSKPNDAPTRNTEREQADVIAEEEEQRAEEQAKNVKEEVKRILDWRFSEFSPAKNLHELVDHFGNECGLQVGDPTTTPQERFVALDQCFKKRISRAFHSDMNRGLSEDERKRKEAVQKEYSALRSLIKDYYEANWGP